MFHGEHFLHPLGAKFSIAKFCDDGHNLWLSSSHGVEQFTCCDMAVIPKQCINLVFGLHHCYYGTAGPVTNVLDTALRSTDPASN